MYRKQTAAALAAAALLLSGCGTIFEREYVSVEDMTPSENTSSDSSTGETHSIHSYAGLKQAIRELLYSGTEEGTIVLDADYDGEVEKDLSAACRELRTNDALCAYCVDSISFEVSQIVTYSEADIHISYGSVACPAADISKLSFATNMEPLLLQNMEQGKRIMAVLIANTDRSAEDISELIQNLYTQNPYVSPAEPTASVNVYSGSGMQKLYEITINYGVAEAMRSESMADLLACDPFADLDIESMTDAEKITEIVSWLRNNCIVSDQGGSSAYSAIVLKSADSEGMALGFNELCRRLNITSRIIYGQYQWTDHCWNLVELDGTYYHIDLSLPAEEEELPLKSDAEMWNDYRWDTTQYPACDESLTLTEDSE